jgi:hypothetical protein
MTHTITLELHEATSEQLRVALDAARRSAAACERQGSGMHTWHARAAAITTELQRRR